MNFAKKIFLTGFLAFGIFLTSGCDDVSYETKFESSSSVEVNSSGASGDANFSSSYKETKSKSDGDFTFKANDINLSDGKTEFNFSITNNTDKDLVLNGMKLSFKATDENKKVVREGNCNFENLAIKLPAGQEIYENFVVEDSNATAYNESFHADYEISNIVTDPPTQENVK